MIKVDGLILVSRRSDGKIHVDDDFHAARKGAIWGAVGGAARHRQQVTNVIVSIVATASVQTGSSPVAGSGSCLAGRRRICGAGAVPSPGDGDR